MKMNLNEYITEEFSPTEFDPGFIKDVVGEYKGKINLNGNLIDDGLIDESYEIKSLNDIVEGPEPNTYFALGWVNTSSYPNGLSKILHISNSGEVLNVF